MSIEITDQLLRMQSQLTFQHWNSWANGACSAVAHQPLRTLKVEEYLFPYLEAELSNTPLLEHRLGLYPKTDRGISAIRSGLNQTNALKSNQIPPFSPFLNWKEEEDKWQRWQPPSSQSHSRKKQDHSSICHTFSNCTITIHSNGAIGRRKSPACMLLGKQIRRCWGDGIHKMVGRRAGKQGMWSPPAIRHWCNPLITLPHEWAEPDHHFLSCFNF